MLGDRAISFSAVPLVWSALGTLLAHAPETARAAEVTRVSSAEPSSQSASRKHSPTKRDDHCCTREADHGVLQRASVRRGHCDAVA